MKIVGHRGASGVALENTRESLRAAVAAGASEFEIDVRLTKDGHFVLSHDRSLKRVSGHQIVVSEATLQELHRIKLHNGEPILTLDEALQLAKPHSLVVEAKASDWAQPLAKALKKRQTKVRGVIAFNHRELAAFHDLCPDIPTYALSLFNAYRTLGVAKRHHLSGIGVGYWQINPHLYRSARRANLEVYVYTINTVWLARVLKRLYPDISIATNYPEKLAFLAD
jgi:glycerophosphoryl diester phosphodiesterase